MRKQIPVLRADTLSKCLNMLANEQNVTQSLNVDWVLRYLADIVKVNAFLIDVEEDNGEQ